MCTGCVRVVYASFGGKMTDPVTRAQELLKEHRASIDRLDAEFAKSFLNFIIREVIQNHKKFQ